MLLLDTSGLLATMDADQRFHRAAREVLEGASRSLILSPFVFAELDHLLLTRVGKDAQLALLGEVTRSTYRSRTVFDVRRRRGKGGDRAIRRLRRRRPGRRFQRGASQTPRRPRHPHARRAPLPRDLPFRVLPADS